MDSTHYALSLFAVIKKPESLEGFRLPDAVVEQLHLYLKDSLGIECLDVKVMEIGNDPFLLLREVSPKSLAALCSLADVQKTQLFRYERQGEDEATLTPVVLDIKDV